jgi:hypothetical protein
MMPDDRATIDHSTASPRTSSGDASSQRLLGGLIAVLKPHERGLRRWSVMRAMREHWKSHSRDIPIKFEQDIERVFRRYCIDHTESLVCSRDVAPFFRPRASAGEVWAMYPDRADALLSSAQ